jgi:hypothetical protein
VRMRGQFFGTAFAPSFAQKDLSALREPRLKSFAAI